MFKIMHGFSDMNKTKLFKMKDDSVNLQGHGTCMKIQKQHASKHQEEQLHSSCGHPLEYNVDCLHQQ